MVKIITKINPKKNLFVGPGWVDCFKNIDWECDGCGTPISIYEPYLFSPYVGVVCKKCFDLHKNDV